MSRARKLALFALCSLLLFGGGFVCNRVAERGRFTGAYSSYGSGPNGTRGLFLLAQALGARPRRWSEDLAALPAGGGMLVALGDCESGIARELSRYEQSELEQWVKDGGVLLVAGVRGYLPAGLGVTFEPDPRCKSGLRLFTHTGAQPEGDADGEGEGSEGDANSDDAPSPAANAFGPDAGVPGSAAVAPDAGVATVQIVPVAPASDSASDLRFASPVDEPLRHLPPIPMREPARLVIEPQAAARVILTLPDAPEMPISPVQREAGVIVSHGRGKLIVIASGSMLQNRSLSVAEGGVLFARLLAAYAPAGPVLFDEYHLGVGERRSLVRYLRQAGATPFALQLLLVALLLLWRGGARFGAVRVAREPPPPGTASFVSALGGLFRRAADPVGAVQILSRQALGRVAARHHLPLASAHKLAHELDARGRHAAAEAVREIAAAERILVAERFDLAAVSNKIDAAVERACAELA